MLDLQMVSISLRIMFRPDDNQLFTIYRKLGHDYHARVLPSVVNEVLRSVVARYSANQLAHQREQVSWEIRSSLQERLRDFNIVLEDTSITELEFGRDYQRAVEEKQIAEQQAQRAKFIVEKAQQEKKAKIVWAEGEAQAIRDVGSRLGSSTAYLDLMRVKIAVDVAKVLQRSRCRVFLQADTLLLNLQQPIQ